MPAGDLVTQDWQAEIRATLTGFGTPWLIDIEAPSGFGVTAKSHDTDLAHAAGVYEGRDYDGPLIVTVPYVLRGAVACAAFFDLRDLWVSSETVQTLHLRLPYLGTVGFTGRPRGLMDDMRGLHAGVIRALGTFHCGDPTLTVTP